MTTAQARRIESFERRVSVAGAVSATVDEMVYKGRFHDTRGAIIIGWERSRDGRDMTTLVDQNGRTIFTRPTYS